MEAKKYVVEDGMMYYPKKPLYKQVLFWTSLVGFLLTFVFGLSTVLLTSYVASPSYYEDQLVVEDSYDTAAVYRDFQVGETATFADGLSVRVKDLTKDSEIQLVNDYYDTAILVALEVENTSNGDIYFDESSFYLVNSFTESLLELDARTYDVNIPEKLSGGEKIEVHLVFAAYESDLLSSLLLYYDDASWGQLVTEGA